MSWPGFKQGVVDVFYWLATPFRATGRAIRFIVDLTPQQMQSFATLSMIAGIMANSVWVYIYVRGIRTEIKNGMDPQDNPFFEASLDVIFYTSLMSGMFALFVSAIAFGADYLQVRYKDLSIGAGDGEAPQPEPEPEPDPERGRARAMPEPEFGRDQPTLMPRPDMPRPDDDERI